MKDKSLCHNCPIPCASESFFAGLSPEQAAALNAASRRSVYQKGEVLFSLGDPAHFLFLIHQGNVKLVNYDAEGREKIVAIFGAGEWILGGLFLKQTVFPFYGIAMDEAIVCKVPSGMVEDLLKEGRGALSVVEMLSKKLHDANERNMILSTSSPKARVARFLAYRASVSHSDELQIKLSDIAFSVSLRPETVSRKLAELLNEGILERTGQSGLRIHDIDALMETANH